jgi:hypothetical protein
MGGGGLSVRSGVFDWQAGRLAGQEEKNGGVVRTVPFLVTC